MTIIAPDLKIIKSTNQSDSPTGGGPIGNILNNVVISDVVNNLFPNVSAGDKVDGKVQLRKIFSGCFSLDNSVYSNAHLILKRLSLDEEISEFIFNTNSNSDTQGDNALAELENCYQNSGAAVGTALTGVNSNSGDHNILFKTAETKWHNEYAGDGTWERVYDIETTFTFDVVDHQTIYLSDGASSEYLMVNSISTTISVVQKTDDIYHIIQYAIINLVKPLLYSHTTGKAANSVEVNPSWELFGIVKLSEDAPVGSNIIEIESNKSRLIPSCNIATSVVSETPYEDKIIIGPTVYGTGEYETTINVSHVYIQVPFDVAESGVTNYVGSVGLPVTPSTLKIHFKKLSFWYLVEDDGAGNLTGDGSGTVTYATGAINLTTSLNPDAGTHLIAGFNIDKDPVYFSNVAMTWSDVNTYNFNVIGEGYGESGRITNRYNSITYTNNNSDIIRIVGGVIDNFLTVDKTYWHWGDTHTYAASTLGASALSNNVVQYKGSGSTRYFLLRPNEPADGKVYYNTDLMSSEWSGSATITLTGDHLNIEPGEIQGTPGIWILGLDTVLGFRANAFKFSDFSTILGADPTGVWIETEGLRAVAYSPSGWVGVVASGANMGRLIKSTDGYKWDWILDAISGLPIDGFADCRAIKYVSLFGGSKWVAMGPNGFCKNATSVGFPNNWTNSTTTIAGNYYAIENDSYGKIVFSISAGTLVWTKDLDIWASFDISDYIWTMTSAASDNLGVIVIVDFETKKNVVWIDTKTMYDNWPEAPAIHELKWLNSDLDGTYGVDDTRIGSVWYNPDDTTWYFWGQKSGFSRTMYATEWKMRAEALTDYIVARMNIMESYNNIVTWMHDNNPTGGYGIEPATTVMANRYVLQVARKDNLAIKLDNMNIQPNTLNISIQDTDQNDVFVATTNSENGVSDFVGEGSGTCYERNGYGIISFDKPIRAIDIEASYSHGDAVPVTYEGMELRQLPVDGLVPILKAGSKIVLYDSKTNDEEIKTVSDVIGNLVYLASVTTNAYSKWDSSPTGNKTILCSSTPYIDLQAKYDIFFDQNSWDHVTYSDTQGVPAAGTYDIGNYPPRLLNIGTETAKWVIEIKSVVSGGIPTSVDIWSDIFGKIVDGLDLKSDALWDTEGGDYVTPGDWPGAGTGVSGASWILPTNVDAAGRYYSTISGGVTGVSEPDWTTALGDGEVIVDGTVTWAVGSHPRAMYHGEKKNCIMAENPSIIGRACLKLDFAGLGGGWVISDIIRTNTIAARFPDWAIRIINKEGVLVDNDSTALQIRGYK